MMCSSVLLPDPERPSIAMNSPVRIVRSTPFNTSTKLSPIWKTRWIPFARRIVSPKRETCAIAGRSSIIGLFPNCVLDSLQKDYSHRNASTGFKRAARIAGISAPRTAERIATATMTDVSIASILLGIVSKA